MDGANWRPTQGAGPAAGAEPNAAAPAVGDWRAQFQPEARSRIVNKIMETLKKHLPLSVPEGLNERQKIAVQFEEKIYTTATSQSDYLRKVSLKMLSMEAPKPQGPQQPPGNAQVIPNQNPSGPAPGLPPQGSNPMQSSAIPLVSQQQARQPNTSTSVQASSLSNLGQSLPGVSQTSTLQNMSGMPHNTMNNGLAQGASQDINAAQRQMAGRQQQQSQNQLIYQQQQILMKQKLQQNSLMQLHIQQQQSLLQSTEMQSSQQPMMQMSSSLQTGQSTILQTQPMAMQLATQSCIQQNPLNSVQQSVQSLLQQPPQSVVRQQQQPQPSMHQQPSLQQAQPTQQPNTPLQQQQQQLMGQQPNLQQNQLIGQQNGAVEMQQQQRLPVQSNNLLNMQQTQQMLNQQSMPLHQPQQLGSQVNMPSLQQQQLLGTVPRMHMLQTKASVQQPQQQQHAQQPSMGLMQPQSQHNQLQQSQQHLMSQFQPNQLQQQLGMQQQPSMQQRLQTSAGIFLQQNNIDQQKQFFQSQRGLQEVSSSTSEDSTAQTGHAGAGDWQEEIYQMVKSLKDQYFAELSELYNKICVKLQHVDSMIPPQKPSDLYEKVKHFKMMLERTLQVLQVNKNNIQPALREKVPAYERQIMSILNSQRRRRKPVQTQGQQQFQQPAGQAPSSNISQQQQPCQASEDCTAQTGHAGAGDWQEEIYQMVKSLKDQYFADLSELYNKICVKLQHVDSMIPPQKPSDQYEKMKGFKVMLERTLQFLQIKKNNIQPALREKVPAYERQIMSILNSQRRKPVQTQGQQQFQQSAGQAPSSNISQQQQPSQGLSQHDSHTNQMPQESLPSMSTGLQSSSAAGSRPLRWRRSSVRTAPTSSPSTRTRRCSISLRSLRMQLRQRPLPPHGALLAVTTVGERRVAGLGEAPVLGRLLQRLPQHALLQAPPAARPRPRRRRPRRPVLLVQEQRPSNSRRSSLWRRLHSKRGISVRAVIF